MKENMKLQINSWPSRFMTWNKYKRIFTLLWLERTCNTLCELKYVLCLFCYIIVSCSCLATGNVLFAPIWLISNVNCYKHRWLSWLSWERRWGEGQCPSHAHYGLMMQKIYTKFIYICTKIYKSHICIYAYMQNVYWGAVSLPCTRWDNEPRYILGYKRYIQNIQKI